MSEYGDESAECEAINCDEEATWLYNEGDSSLWKMVCESCKEDLDMEGGLEMNLEWFD